MSQLSELDADRFESFHENQDSKDLSSPEEIERVSDDLKEDTVMMENEQVEDVEMNVESAAISEDSEDGTASLPDENLDASAEADVELEQKDVELAPENSEETQVKENNESTSETPRESELFKTFLEMCRNPKAELTAFKEDLLQVKRNMVQKVYIQSKRKL
jgi:hypothetical protein